MNKIKLYIIIILSIMMVVACGKSVDKKNKNQPSKDNQRIEHEHEGEQEHEGGHDDHAEENQVHLTSSQLIALEMKIDTLQMRNMSDYVETNGQLEVPPQNEASVTAIIGANINTIEVIEGDKVKKGQILAYLSHPDLIELQTEFIVKMSQLNYLENEYNRQKKLYDEKIGSGKEYQKTMSEYLSLRGNVEGHKTQLKMLGLNIDNLLDNTLYERVPLFSPISGYVRLVNIKIGQYVDQTTELFQIVNIDEILADLMVFEKDMLKIKEGQKVRLKLTSQKELNATIFSIGKAFEQNPKAIHIHADIEKEYELLIPGTYIRGQILVNNKKSLSIPESGVLQEDNKSYIFTVLTNEQNSSSEVKFNLLEISTGVKSDGFVEVKLLKPLPKGTKVALNNAYYLFAELKKGEAEHTH